MDIIDIEFESWHNILIKINWPIIILTLVLIILVAWLMKKSVSFLSRKSIDINEVELGIGNSKLKLKINNKDREIAYRIWVEMTTRKISIPFDKNNDVIVEVYDSWYEFFRIARDAIKEIPVQRLSYCEELISLTDRILNNQLRRHLTSWQAKFRKWYSLEAENNPKKTPQEIQQSYNEYDLLVEDLVDTNERLIKYCALMKKIAFKE